MATKQTTTESNGSFESIMAKLRSQRGRLDFGD